MSQPPPCDPFAHHPELRDKVRDPLGSGFRTLTLASLQTQMDDLGLPGGWWYSDADREAMRQAFLATLPPGDLWVFAYGSLMTDPGIVFSEVRRATLPGHRRRFILRDVYGGRGTPEAPGLMAALDTAGPQDLCHGLAFRISADLAAAETKVLWQREMIAPCYRPVMIGAEVGTATVPVLAFLADHQSGMIAADISRAEQIRLIATGSGFLGTSLAYLENIDRQFEALGITDPDTEELLAEVRRYNLPSG